DTKEAKAFLKTMKDVRIEKIIIIGAPEAWGSKTEVVAVREDGQKEKTVPLMWRKGDGKRANWAVVRDPGVGVGKGWQVEF
ncbi:MAG: hypothetical protein Q9177_004988, partial [Variospora cf. flavescens]